MEGQIAPGAFGKAVFYITPLSRDITGYAVLPEIVLVKTNQTEQEVTEEFLGMLNKHIRMYTDEAHTQVITKQSPAMGSLAWDADRDRGVEKEVTLYWKWYYEYPFAVSENVLPEKEKRKKKELYDKEDTMIGTQIDTMQFQFEFQAIL